MLVIEFTIYNTDRPDTPLIRYRSDARRSVAWDGVDLGGLGDGHGPRLLGFRYLPDVADDDPIAPPREGD